MAGRPPMYQPRVAARSMPLPRTGASNGEATAQAMGGVADAIGRASDGFARVEAGALRTAEIEADAAAEVERIEDERQLSSARLGLSARFAEFSGELGREAIALRERAGPGAAGHVAAFRTLIDERGGAFLNGVTDPRLRDEFAARLAQYGASATVQEEGFAAATRADYVRTTTGQMIELWGNNVHTVPTAENYQLARQTVGDAIGGLAGVSDELKQRLTTDARETLASMLVLGMHRENPGAALQLLQSGALNADISPARRAVIEGQVISQVRYVENQQEQARNAAQSQLRTDITDILHQIDQGVIVDDQLLEALGGRATEAGLDRQAFDIGVVRVRNNVARETLPWRPEQYEQAINALRAKGENITPQEAVRLRALEQLQGVRSQRFREDRAGWEASNGNPPPADWGQRVRWHRSLPPGSAFLTPEETRTIREEMGRGPMQQIAVAERLYRLNDVGAIMAAARQVKGDDDTFLAAVRMGMLPGNEQAMRDVIEGADALRASPDMFNEREARNLFNRQFGAANAMPAEYRAGLWEATKRLYAARAARHGVTSWQPGNFEMAIQRAHGARGSGATMTGGVQQFNGADGRPYWTVMPSSMTRTEFEARWRSLQNFSGWPAGSVNGPPVHRDGSEVYSEPLVGYVPVAVEDGRYHVWTGNHYLQTRTSDGRLVPFVIDLRRATPAIDGLNRIQRRRTGQRGWGPSWLGGD